MEASLLRNSQIAQLLNCLLAGCQPVYGWMLGLTILLISLSINNLKDQIMLSRREPPVIKLDIINEVVAKDRHHQDQG